MTPFQRLLQYFRRYKLSLFLGGLCVIGSSVFSLAKPAIIGNAVNQLATSITRSVLLQFAVSIVVVAIFQGIFLYLQRWIVIGVSRKIEYDMRQDFYEHLQSLPPKFYQQHRTGDLMSRASNDLASVRMLIGPAVMHSFSALLIVFGALIMMMRIDVSLALISLAGLPLVAGVVKYFGEKIHDKFKAVQEYFGELSARIQENLAGVRVVRAFAQEPNEVETFRKMNREYVSRNRRLIMITATFYPLLHLFIGVMFVLVFAIGSRKILSGSMTIGDFVAFQFYLGRMIWPLIAIGWVINLFQRGMASMKRLNEIWVEQPDAHRTIGPCTVDQFSGDIEIKDLTFTYDRRPVLRNINLNVASGQTVGIVGRTGSGKSTLLSLLTRMVEPPPGTIYVDGCPIEAIPVTKLRDAIGAVPQETFLFSESIAENIRFGREAASPEETRNVAALAGLGEDLSEFPQGIDTIVGERGITLSGGQKQRTAIARAILRDPAILILDDALSAVDTQTEERILAALREVRRNRTVLIVSHRVSSVKDADQIIVLDDGEIVERGTHETLVERGGYYADLYRRQTLEEELEKTA